MRKNISDPQSDQNYAMHRCKSHVSLIYWDLDDADNCNLSADRYGLLDISRGQRQARQQVNLLQLLWTGLPQRARAEINLLLRNPEVMRADVNCENRPLQ